MTLDELKTLCAEKIEHPSMHDEVMLLIPGKARGETKRLPHLGVRGFILESHDAFCLCSFKPYAIMAAIKRVEKNERTHIWTLALKDVRGLGV